MAASHEACSAAGRSWLTWTALLVLQLLGGCAAVTNPVGVGVPVRRLPPEVRGQSREALVTVPLDLLRQTQPDVYRLDAGDVLGIWIATVLGDPNQAPPVRPPEQGQARPSLGYPVPVRDDGTITLPLIEPLPVRGKTLAEVREAIRKAYTVPRQILKPGEERILVELQQRRTYHVLVIRQDSGGLVVGPAGTLGNTKRGTGFPLDLPAYENDVLNALTRTGGFPGLDARNEVVVVRGTARSRAEASSCPPAGRPAAKGSGQPIRIPLRLRPDQPPPFTPEDIILRNGDTLYIESRDTEVFYTGGLLGSGQYVLPRDIDLDVVEAIALVRGPLINGSINQNNLNGNLLQPGVGFPSPSLVTIIRRTPGYGQLLVKVDLNRALNDPRERLLIQPKDLIIMQETVGEAVTRYFTQVFRLNFLGTILRQRDAIATTNLAVP